jgi:hypothetical protein
MDDQSDWASELPPEEERVTDAEERRVVQLVLQDVRATVGPAHDDIVISNAHRLREFVRVSQFEGRLVNDVQQEIHDLFIDTTWPACPLHSRHPLWYGGGGWRCEEDGAFAAPLGLLKRSGTPNELAFPVLCLSRDTSISVADDEAALTRCNALAFFRNRYFENLLVIDSRAAAFRVTAASPEPLSPIRSTALRLTNGVMRVTFQLSPEPMTFAEIRKAVLAWLDLTPEFWEESRDMEEWRDAVGAARSVGDLISLFR